MNKLTEAARSFIRERRLAREQEPLKAEEQKIPEKEPDLTRIIFGHSYLKSPDREIIGGCITVHPEEIYQWAQEDRAQEDSCVYIADQVYREAPVYLAIRNRGQLARDVFDYLHLNPSASVEEVTKRLAGKTINLDNISGESLAGPVGGSTEK